MLAADWASADKVFSVHFQGGPPEPLLQDLLGALDTRVTGEPRTVGPLKDIRPQILGNKQAVLGTGTGTWLTLQGGLVPLSPK